MKNNAFARTEYEPQVFSERFNESYNIKTDRIVLVHGSSS
jgi:hypothetical protein